MLSKEENKRYNRHLILDQVGEVGQQKLQAAKVLVIGAGGLGCPVLQYLTAAGIGTIGIIDFDTVALSNLQRQILFTTTDIGRNKAEVAAERLKQLNEFVSFQVHPYRLTTLNALELFKEYDIVVDGTDNFATRYLVNDASVLSEKPLVYGSIYKFQGQVSVFNYQKGPSYRCLFPTPPAAGTIKNCSEIGVIGVLPGIIGTQQANEAIKLILEIGETLSGKLLIYDALAASSALINIKRNTEEIEAVKANRANFINTDYEIFCGMIEEKQGEKYITFEELQKSIGQESTRIIDLREVWEEPELTGSNVERITVSGIMHQINRFLTDKKVILVCQSSTRSTNVRHLLEQNHKVDNIFELKGGMGSYVED